MNKKLILALFFAAVVAIGGFFSYAYSHGNSSSQAPTQSGPKDSSDAKNPDSYVGMKESEAVSRAERAGLAYRIIRRDAENYSVTFDYNPDRINFEIDKGIVTKAFGG